MFVSKLCSVPLNCSCVADFVAIPCSFDYYLKKKESVIFNHHNFNYIVVCFIFLWLHLIWNSLDFLYLTVSFPRLGRFLAISSSNNSVTLSLSFFLLGASVMQVLFHLMLSQKSLKGSSHLLIIFCLISLLCLDDFNCFVSLLADFCFCFIHSAVEYLLCIFQLVYN